MKKTGIALVFFLAVSLLFFYPIFKGLIPFPGDLLVGNYAPYNSNSYGGYVPGSIPHKAQGPDVIRQLMPWKYFTIDSLKNLTIPFWNPYNFSGNPHLANMQSGVFYPINIFFLMFPFVLGWTIYIFLQPVLAGFFTYLFLREIRLTTAASLFGGLAFAFSAFMVVWLEYGTLGHTFLWLPLIFFLILRFLDNPSVLKSVALIIACTMSLFAGYIQLTMYIYIVSLFFIFFLFFKDKKKEKRIGTYLFLGSSFMFPLFLSAVQLLPTVEIFQHSSRTSFTFNQLSERLIPLVNIITIFIPDFFGNPASRNYWVNGTYIEKAAYIGFLPFVFSFFAWHERKSFYTPFFVVAALLTYISALHIPITQFIHSIGIPLLSTGVPSRILSVFCFLFSVVAAIGFSAWEKEENKGKYLKILLIPSFFLLGTWIFVLGINQLSGTIAAENISIIKRNMILPTLFLIGGGFLLYVNKFIPKKLIIIGLFILTAFDLFYFFHKITPFSPKEYMYPKTNVFTYLKQNASINRYWGYGTAYIDTNFQTYEKIYSTDGYDPLHLQRYNEFVSSSKNGLLPKQIPRSDANIIGGYGTDDLRNNQYRQRALNLLGVKYIFNKKGIDNSIPKESYKLAWQEGEWEIYENKEALPRVFLASQYIVDQDKENIIKKLFDKNFDIVDTVVLEEKLPMQLQSDKNATVQVVDYAPNKITIKSLSDSNMLLFLSDNFYPGWKVSIDGKDGKIYRANYSFRAVPVERGSHEVVFSYYPLSFDAGKKVSIGTLIIFFLFLSIIKFKRIYV